MDWRAGGAGGDGGGGGAAGGGGGVVRSVTGKAPREGEMFP